MKSQQHLRPRLFAAMRVTPFFILLFAGRLALAELPEIPNVEFQPLAAATQRLIDALDYIGSPLSDEDQAALKQAIESDDDRAAATAIQRILDRYCLFGVHINPESRVKVAEGPAKIRPLMF